MSHKSRRPSHPLNAAKQHWSNEISASSDDSSFSMNIDDEIKVDDILYLTLRHLNISYQETLTFLKHIGGNDDG